MMTAHYTLISDAISDSINLLQCYGEEVDTGRWQGVPTEGKPDLVTKEFINLSWQSRIPPTQEALANACEPNLPWAEDHFQERVSRVPTNPGEQYKNWPWWKGQDAHALTEGRGPTDPKFSHTYQERFWPRHAAPSEIIPSHAGNTQKGLYGIRYAYGDLDDVVNLLLREPHTRQATFPIFFPEDTGAVHGGRVPCTLHYHFLLRRNRLHLWYPIRSCDAVRHFRDDIYMAGRLCQWVIQELTERDLREGDGDQKVVWDAVTPGYLHFTAYSFHVHKGDAHLL